MQKEFLEMLLNFCQRFAGPLLVGFLLLACSAGAPGSGASATGGGVGEDGLGTVVAQATGARQDSGAPSPDTQVGDDEKFLIYFSVKLDDVVDVSGEWTRFKVLGVFLQTDGCPLNSFNGRIIRVVDYNKRQYFEILVNKNIFETAVDVAPAAIDPITQLPKGLSYYVAPTDYVGEVGEGVKPCPAQSYCGPAAEKNQVLLPGFFPIKDPEKCSSGTLDQDKLPKYRYYKGDEPDFGIDPKMTYDPTDPAFKIFRQELSR